MHLDPILPVVVAVVLAVVLVGAALRALHQPYVVAYLVAGVLVGPHGIGLITDQQFLHRLGDFGVVLLLFFVGMEVSLPRLISAWRIAILGTLFQIMVSVAFVAAIGLYLDWPLGRIVLLGFVISLSSTAVVFKILQDWKEVDTSVGQNVIGVLLVQDVALVPMLVVLGLLGGSPMDRWDLGLQLVGAVVCVGLVAWIVRRKTIHLPFRALVVRDHEVQVFTAMILCFGMALFTGLTGLSTALGAFIGGLIVSAARETAWVHDSLDSFRVVFISLFFVSIGLLIDVGFIVTHAATIAVLVAVVMLTNTFINAGILRLLGDTWTESLYAGALLSQVGEFSFLLAAIGLSSGIIAFAGYQTAIATIALSLALSPLWVQLVKRLVVAKASGSAAPVAS